MIAFIIRRLLQAFVVMCVVALIAFTMFQFVGDPDIIVNLRSANSLGYEFPAEILGDATIVIQ